MSKLIDESERDMYERGEIAPAMYTFMMQISYNWYLLGDHMHEVIENLMSALRKKNDPIQGN